MIQVVFAERAVAVLKDNPAVIGLAAAGSWLTNELDEFSDLDLIVITREKISNDKNKMLSYARAFGNLLSGFTGEHVGEPRLLICLYADPLLHVDIKFVTLDEFHERIENPAILLDTNGQLANALAQSVAKFPYPDHQWMEDRFWIWVHYALLKIGRGELLEAYDFLGFIRLVVLGPLLLEKNNRLPRGVRKVETLLAANDLDELKATLAVYEKKSLLSSLRSAVSLYRTLRHSLYEQDIQLRLTTEEKVMQYFEFIEHLENK